MVVLGVVINDRQTAPTTSTWSSIHDVFQSTVHDKQLYCAPAWLDFAQQLIEIDWMRSCIDAKDYNTAIALCQPSLTC